MKHIQVIILTLILFTVTSCLDKLSEIGNNTFCPGIRLEDGSCPLKDNANNPNIASGWDITKTANFNFNENYLEIDNGKISLKNIDTEFSDTNFKDGTHAGSGINQDNKIFLLNDKTSSDLDVTSILQPFKDSLVAYWKIDNSLNDSSGNGNNLTFNGAAVFSTDSQLGSASGYFNDNGVAIIENSTLMPTSQLTFSAWVKPESLAGGRRLIAGGYQGTNDHSFSVLVSTNHKTWRVSLIEADGNERTIFGNLLIPTEQWSHVVVTADGTNINLYVNGVLDKSLSYDGTIKPVTTCWGLGARPRNADCSWFDQRWDGHIDEVALWDKALSAQDVKELNYNQRQNYTGLSSHWSPEWDSIIGYWEMDGNWQDSSGNNYHGSPSGTTSFSTNSKIGTSSAYFDGTGGKFRVNSNIQNKFNKAKGTVSCWLYNQNDDFTDVTNRYAFRTYFAGGNNDGLYMRFYSNDSFQFNYFGNANGSGVTVSNFKKDIPLNSWTHVIGTWDINDEQKLKLYINGRLYGEATQTQLITGTYSFMDFGYGTTTAYKGSIDDCSMWSIDLNASQVSHIYNRQKQKYAASYTSPVIDIGESGEIINFSHTTDLPFMKELVNTSEAQSSYISSSADLSNGLVGYWSFNEALIDGLSGADFEDLSTNDNHLLESGGVSNKQQGILDKSISLDGNDDYLTGNTQLPRDQGTLSHWLLATSTGNRIAYYQSDGTSSLYNGWGHSNIHEIHSGIYDGEWAFHIQDGTSTSGKIFSSTGITVETGKWTHVLVTWQRSDSLKIYINGSLVKTEDLSTKTFANLTPTEFRVGRTGYNDSQRFWHGSIDELAIWNVALNSSQVTELYRRSANRVKYQIRTCPDSSCSTDPKWQGPGGDGTTSFSELYNRTPENISRILSLCDTSGDNLCSTDEFGLNGPTRPTPYKFDLASSLINNYNSVQTRFFQYRALMEAQQNNACEGNPCLPSITAIKFETANEYYDMGPSITSTSPITISDDIIKVEQVVVGQCSVKYQFSKDGTSFYYYNSGTWQSAIDSTSQANSIQQISSTLKNFVNFGPLYVRAYLESNGTQSCELQSFTITQ